MRLNVFGFFAVEMPVIIFDGAYFCSDAKLVTQEPEPSANLLKVEVLPDGSLVFPEDEYSMSCLNIHQENIVSRFNIGEETSFWLHHKQEEAEEHFTGVWLNEHGHNGCERCADRGSEHCLEKYLDKLRTSRFVHVYDCEPDDMEVTWWIANELTIDCQT